MIFRKPLPFQEALDSLSARTILPTEFRTRLLREMAPQVRDRAFFSAGVTNVGVLERAQQAVTELAEGTTDRATQRAELKKLLQSLGYQPAVGEEGTLTDLSSDSRLNLILDTNLELAQAAGSYEQGRDPAILDQWPAQELIRVANFESDKQRDWAARWASVGGEFFGGRMIALKNDPIWQRLGSSANFDDALDVIYPPFAFNSGMDVADVDRDEAVALGLIGRDEQFELPPLEFNQELKASPGVRSENLKRDAITVLLDNGIEAQFDANGVLRYIGGAS